jgi:hypothetical protein
MNDSIKPKPSRDPELDKIATELLACTMAHEGGARLLGNVRACDIALLVAKYVELAAAVSLCQEKMLIADFGVDGETVQIGIYASGPAFERDEPVAMSETFLDAVHDARVAVGRGGQ